MGKTALVRRSLGATDEAIVLEASGDESETGLEYGVVAQLVARARCDSHPFVEEPVGSALSTTPAARRSSPSRPTTAPSDEATETLMRTLRDDTTPRATRDTDITADVGGTTAGYVDLADEISSRLVLAIGALDGPRGLPDDPHQGGLGADEGQPPGGQRGRRGHGVGHHVRRLDHREVFLGFVINGDPTVKQFGVGMAVAVAVDATLVRCLLSPR
jgi:hypothetical protein